MAAFLRPDSGVEETANAVATYTPGGVAPNEYDVRRNPDLARTYRMIAEGGRDVFYDGPIAKTIDAYFKRIGGWLSAEDLREHHAEWVEPLVTNYRGVDVYGMPANTQGLATLQMLNIIENFDVRGFGFQSPQSLQVQIEAKRLAYEDRARYYADPHFAKIPIEWLNSKEYAQERAKLIRLDRILRSCLSRPGAQPRRHHVFHYGRQRRHDGLDHSIELPRHGLGTGRRRPRLHVPGPRPTVFACRTAIPTSTRPASGPSRPSFPALPQRMASRGCRSA